MSPAVNRADRAACTGVVAQGWGQIWAPLEPLPAEARPLPVSASGCLVQERSCLRLGAACFRVGHSSITDQWLCCLRKSPSQHGPARRRAPFPRERAVSSPAFLHRQLYSAAGALPRAILLHACPGSSTWVQAPFLCCLQPCRCGDPTLCLVWPWRPRAGGVAQ